MQSEEQKNGIVVAKFGDGEDFFSSLRDLAKKHEIKSGLILSCIGMLRDLTIGYFVGKGKYAETRIEGPVELTSMQGNIAHKNGENLFHIHLNAADRDKNVHGGHLIAGTVNNVNELTILKLNEISVTRELNKKTRLMEIKITKKL